MAELDRILEQLGGFLHWLGEQAVVFLEGPVQNLLAVFLGVGMALYLYHRMRRRADRRLARKLRLAVVWEAEANLALLNGSVRRYYDRQNAPEGQAAPDPDLAPGEFDTSTTARHLASPVLLQHAAAAELKTIETYLRSIRLANLYSHRLEQWRHQSSTPESQKAMKKLEEALVSHLLDCEENIQAVMKLRGRAKD